MDTTPQEAITAHANAWAAYTASVEAHEAAKEAHSKQYNLNPPHSKEVRDAELSVRYTRNDVRGAHESLRHASARLLSVARALADELNTLWKDSEATARRLWEKHSVGAKLYSTAAREADFMASPWRRVLPMHHSFTEFPARFEDLPDIGEEFVRSVRVVEFRLSTLREAAAKSAAAKP